MPLIANTGLCSWCNKNHTGPVKQFCKQCKKLPIIKAREIHVMKLMAKALDYTKQTNSEYNAYIDYPI